MRRIALLVFALLAVAAPAYAAAPPLLGVDGGFLRGVEPATADQQLAQMRSMGVQLVRADASWQSAQPTPPAAGIRSYDFSADDALVSELATHGITWLPVIDYSTPWAQSVPGAFNSPPTDDADYTAYAQALAARYGAGGSFWTANSQLAYEPVRTFEVWNEEDSSMFWIPSPDPARYAVLYAQTRASIHKVDPDAHVIVGGLLEILPGQADAYVRAMFRAVPSLRGNVDGFGLHPYAVSAGSVLDSVRMFRQTLRSLGEGAVPTDITEFGWSMGAGEAWRARAMRAIGQGLINTDCGIGVVSPYTWYEAAGTGSENYSLTSSAGLLPSGTAWFTGLRSGAGSRVNPLCSLSAHQATAQAARSHRRRRRRHHRSGAVDVLRREDLRARLLLRRALRLERRIAGKTHEPKHAHVS